jgi:NADH dehydrogenase FAD-containing subunit
MNDYRRLILVGAGHAHLHLLSRLREYRQSGLRVTVIAPGPFWYSGLGPSLLGGDAEPCDDTVDVRRMVESSGAEFLEDVVTRILPDQHAVSLRDHPDLNYDALSLNVGSCITGHPGSEEFATPVKPEMRGSKWQVIFDDCSATSAKRIGSQS